MLNCDAAVYRVPANLLSTDSESVDVRTEALNELHCKHDRRVIHAVLHAVCQMNVVLLRQYKLIADEQVNGLDVVAQVLTTCRQAPAPTNIHSNCKYTA